MLTHLHLIQKRIAFQDRELPIYIWYDDYPTHSAKEYAGRVSRAEIRSNSSYGLASLNLTNIKNEDRGWYNCKVLFLDRSPEVSTVTFY